MYRDLTDLEMAMLCAYLLAYYRKDEEFQEVVNRACQALFTD